MQLLNSNFTDIYSNLALEEYLLKNRNDNVFMLWQSEAAVVVGKHQNAMAEINQGYLRQQCIPVARRLSGGGTVYHGLGNINFTYIINGEEGKLVDFKRFVLPIVDFLKTLGVPAEIGTRNDLLVKGLKISGNAEHVFKKRVLHHGTLLFDANLEQLNTSIKIVEGKYVDKAVQSNRSEVTNIKYYLQHAIERNDFIIGLHDYMERFFQDTETLTLTNDELTKIQNLRDNKYATQEWIFSYSPPFAVSTHFQQGKITCKVVKGIIKEISFNDVEADIAGELAQQLIGVKFLYDEIEAKLLQSAALNTNIVDSILKSLFSSS